MKSCRKCGEVKPEEEFHWKQKHLNARQSECAICRNAIAADWRANNPNRTVEYQKQYRRDNKGAKWDQRIQRAYSLSGNAYDELLSEQDNCCAICKLPAEEHRTRLFVDHCHQSGQVRGLLCHLCNSGLGHFRDSPGLLAEAVTYLEKQNEQLPHSDSAIIQSS